MIHFTHFHAPNVAKRYEIVNGLAVKKPAATFKSGPFKTVSVTSMDEFAEFLETLTPGDFITAGVNQTHPSGMCGLGEGDVHRTKENFQFASGKPGLLIIDGDNLGAVKAPWHRQLRRSGRGADRRRGLCPIAKRIIRNHR